VRVLHIKFFSRNQSKINSFIFFFLKNALSLSLTKKHLKKKKKKKVLSILKSPHVDKKAQEQFELKTFIKQLTLVSLKNIKFLIALKKLKTKFFPEMKIKIKFSTNNKALEKNVKKTLNPRNSKVSTLATQPLYKKINQKKIKIISQSIKIFDVFGEACHTYQT
jgi:ribosomal protein S10